MDLLEEVRDLTAKLHSEGIEYALCGGLAMAVYAMPRATLDIDIMVEPGSLFESDVRLRTSGLLSTEHRWNSMTVRFRSIG